MPATIRRVCAADVDAIAARQAGRSGQDAARLRDRIAAELSDSTRRLWVSVDAPGEVVRLSGAWMTVSWPHDFLVVGPDVGPARRRRRGRVEDRRRHADCQEMAVE
jgi:hypothetical protein